MDRNQILERVQVIFRDVLDNEDIVLSEATTADDVEGWDSLSHVLLVVEVEKQFGIQFTSREILSWKKIGDMVECLAGKVGDREW